MGDYYNIDMVSRLASELERSPTYPTNPTKDEQVVDQFGADVNKDMDNKLAPYADVLPLTGPAITDDIKAAVTYEVLSQWKAYIKEYEAAKFWHTKHLEKSEAIFTQLNTVPTERTKSVLIAHDPRDDKLVLPTQASIFAFDNHA
jgi:hypothetical protein